jgi:hypothetical protein
MNSKKPSTPPWLLLLQLPLAPVADVVAEPSNAKASYVVPSRHLLLLLLAEPQLSHADGQMAAVAAAVLATIDASRVRVPGGPVGIHDKQSN